MINLSIEKYCENCPNFQPEVERLFFGDEVTTVIHCADRNKCAEIETIVREAIEKEMKKI